MLQSHSHTHTDCVPSQSFKLLIKFTDNNEGTKVQTLSVHTINLASTPPLYSHGGPGSRRPRGVESK